MSRDWAETWPTVDDQLSPIQKTSQALMFMFNVTKSYEFKTRKRRLRTVINVRKNETRLHNAFWRNNKSDSKDLNNPFSFPLLVSKKLF